ncbi:uncharacterized protein LOC18049454 isoform X2 [Citrus clementina]|uniref:uncharacterized protein LOC18049454 isoform X2 n=1 Tax=Citrus clementina TaxID=85681 RepID=UPI000CECE3AD|nr:uncharacterized protein LOC18049454 isoform X2 [Citrus x clementina]
MVRRANAKKKERAHLSETVNPSAEEVGLLPETTNPSLEAAQLQPANGNDLGRVEPAPKTDTNSGYVSVSRKGTQTVSVSVRRSVRLQGTVTPARNQGIDRVIQEVTLSGSENEEDELPAYQETEQHGPTIRTKNLEDKLDYLVRLLEEQQDRSSPSGSPTPSHSRYKRLYIDSQKKIEALSAENRQLTMRLENALGKLEVVCHTNTILDMLLFTLFSKLRCVLLFLRNFAKEFAVYV